MKKIALTIAAVASLGLAACGGNEPAETNDTVDMNATDEATGDMNAALESADNMLENAGEAVENASEAVDNAADAAADTNAQ